MFIKPLTCVKHYPRHFFFQNKPITEPYGPELVVVRLTSRVNSDVLLRKFLRQYAISER